MVAVIVAGAIAGIFILCNRHAELAWAMPIWLDANSSVLLWAVVITTASYVMTLGVCFAWR
jgi:hypothetical protein